MGLTFVKIFATLRVFKLLIKPPSVVTGRGFKSLHNQHRLLIVVDMIVGNHQITSLGTRVHRPSL